MKRIAKLALFFSNSFVLLFLFSACFYFLGLWVESIRTISVRADQSANLFRSLDWAVSFSLYVSILLSYTYAVRKKISVFASILTVLVLCGAFTFGVFVGIQQLQKVNFSIELDSSIRSKPGLILSRGDATMVLLSEAGFRGPRVMSFSEQELLYQGEEWGPVSSSLVPALPLGNEAPWSIQSILIDFSLSARQLELRFREGFLSFFLYGGSIILFLSSLRFLLGLSSWPLANLFLGAVIFRCILSFEVFLNTTETQFLISSFLVFLVPVTLITPLVFLSLGLLIILYTLMSHLAWGRRKKND
jgi:hypothetical protein